MLDDIIPGVSGLTAAVVILVVCLSEVTKNLLGLIKLKSDGKVLKGFYALLPLFYSFLGSLFMFLAKTISASEIPQQAILIFGLSVASYEIVVKRLPIGGSHVDKDKDNS